MSKINVSINKKIFTLFCKDGDESRIILSAEAFDKKLNELKQSSPNSSSELLMAICILETQDQLSEATKKLKNYNEKISETNIQLLQDIKNIESRLESLTTKLQDANLN
jgi:cell division protein ZapA (FtsZ GTPase activity inhibitor)